jgi:hypothetical protein
VKRLKVGLTLADSSDAQGVLWSSGLHQNIVFLAMLLQRLASIDLVFLVAGGSPHPLAELYGLRSLPPEAAGDVLDVLIEIGARADAAVIAPLRARGGKLVSYVAGNVMAMNFEELANDVRYGDIVSGTPYDAVWITPQHWKMNRDYCALTRSPNVRLAPHIWTPQCLMDSARRLGAVPFWRSPARPTWRVGIFDPNINVLKTFHFPLLVCEQAYRTNPATIDRVLLFGAKPLMGVPHFEQFCAALDISRDGRVFAEARHGIAQMLGAHIDAVVTHQWENALNYLYWDVLYLGWPLVHNSPAIPEVGYYYPDFDPEGGGAALSEALGSHPGRMKAERAKTLEALWAFHIDNPVVQQAYEDLLEALMS